MSFLFGFAELLRQKEEEDREAEKKKQRNKKKREKKKAKQSELKKAIDEEAAREEAEREMKEAEAKLKATQKAEADRLRAEQVDFTGYLAKVYLVNTCKFHTLPYIHTCGGGRCHLYV